MGLFSRFERTVENTVEGVADRFSSAPVSPAAIAKKVEKKLHSERMVGSGKQYAPTLYTVLVNPQDDRAMMGLYPTLSGELETLLSARAAESGLVMDGVPLVRFIADNSLKPGKFEVIAETVAAPIVEQLRDDELQRYGITRGRYEADLAQKQARQKQAAQEARREELRAKSDARAEREARGGRGRLPFGRNRNNDDGDEEEPRMGGRGRRFGRGAAARDYDDYEQDYRQDFGQDYGQGYDDGQPYDNGYDEQPYYGSEPGPDGKRRLPYVPEEEIDRSIDYGEYTFNSLNFGEMDRQAEAGEEQDFEPTPEQLPVRPAPAAPAQAPAQMRPQGQVPQNLPQADPRRQAPQVQQNRQMPQNRRPQDPRQMAAEGQGYPERPSRPFSDMPAGQGAPQRDPRQPRPQGDRKSVV